MSLGLGLGLGSLEGFLSYKLVIMDYCNFKKGSLRSLRMQGALEGLFMCCGRIPGFSLIISGLADLRVQLSEGFTQAGEGVTQ